MVRRTAGRVARLVVAGEIAQVDVLEPGDPGVVLLVVLVLGPLHCVCLCWLIETVEVDVTVAD
jgi:hypothetical protein